MKRRRLRKWVKVTLVIVGVFAFYGIIKVGANNLNNMYEQCDNAKGYTCSYYEARLYSIRGE